jgi:predicted CopG family antitoxin
MKSITITIEDDVYRAATEEAARQRKSLSELVQELIERISGKGAASELSGSEEEREAREEFDQFFAELNAQPSQEGPSVGPLNREELHQRGSQSAEQAEAEAKRAAFLEQLHRLVEEARERDRDKEGRLVPLTREVIYAERLDRFR